MTPDDGRPGAARCRFWISPMKPYLPFLLLASGLAVAGLVPPARGAAFAAGPGAPAGGGVERARQEVLVAAVEKRFVTATVKVSDAEVESFYAAHLSEFAGSERLVLRHLFRRLSAHAPKSEREVIRTCGVSMAVRVAALSPRPSSTASRKRA